MINCRDVFYVPKSYFMKTTTTDIDFSPEQPPESTKELQKILDKLADDGYVYALCPSCRIPLSAKERYDLECNICKSNFKLDDILYTHNDSPS